MSNPCIASIDSLTAGSKHRLLLLGDTAGDGLRDGDDAVFGQLLKPI